MNYTQVCTGCGMKQTTDGECWDYGECSKCFVKMSMREIANAQQQVPMRIVPSIYILGPEPHEMNTILDQALQVQPSKFLTPKEIEKAQQNLEWVVS